MILNDLNTKVKQKSFVKEVIVEDQGENISYVFPDTEEFLSILKRKEFRK